MKPARVVLLPGDGIGPEVVDAARRTLEVVTRGFRDLEFEEAPIGGRALDEHGEALPAATLRACRRADAILLGAVGGPRWSHLDASARPEQGLLALRKELGLFANLRPIPRFPGLEDASPLKASVLEGVDLLVVRELTGGIYFGHRREAEDGDVASDTMVYEREEIARIAHLAFRIARGRRRRLTSVDKANVLASSRLWRRVVEEVARDYPDVELEHLLVDACAMHLITRPAEFDVLLASNLFGDILSDEASVLAASLGLLPSASLGKGRLGLYEPVHGSAPDLAGQGIANPVAAILSAALLLRHSLGLEEPAACLESAVRDLLREGWRTPDLCGRQDSPCSARELTDALVERLVERKAAVTAGGP